MTTWQENVITAVNFKEDGYHILKVEVRKNLPTSLSSGEPMDRKYVVASLKAGNKFITATLKDKKWHVGDDVEIVTINRVDFIRTDGNSTARDNLGELPEF